MLFRAKICAKTQPYVSNKQIESRNVTAVTARYISVQFERIYISTR